jgi:alpha-acetolactate decarboxylase
MSEQEPGMEERDTSLSGLLAELRADDVRRSAEEAVANTTISITGELEGMETIMEMYHRQAYEEVGKAVLQLPEHIEENMKDFYSEVMTEQQRNLVLSGVHLAILAMRNWTRIG